MKEYDLFEFCLVHQLDASVFSQLYTVIFTVEPTPTYVESYQKELANATTEEEEETSYSYD